MHCTDTDIIGCWQIRGFSYDYLGSEFLLNVCKLSEWFRLPRCKIVVVVARKGIWPESFASLKLSWSSSQAPREGYGPISKLVSLMCHWFTCWFRCLCMFTYTCITATDAGATTSAIHCWPPSIHCARPYGLELLARWPPRTAGLRAWLKWPILCGGGRKTTHCQKGTSQAPFYCD